MWSDLEVLALEERNNVVMSLKRRLSVEVVDARVVMCHVPDALRNRALGYYGSGLQVSYCQYWVQLSRSDLPCG